MVQLFKKSIECDPQLQGVININGFDHWHVQCVLISAMDIANGFDYTWLGGEETRSAILSGLIE